jgi:NADH dehydrogenase [ubiquinone] 1 alpha subcomplex assembly factor 4
VIDDSLSEHPEIIEETTKKDKGLDDRLKNVFVTSSHEIDQKRIINPERPLPTSKEFAGYFELGYQEPEFITPGKATLKQIIQFLGDYHLHPEVWTVEKIALEYKLSLENAASMVEYYKLFSMQLPKPDEKNKRKLLKSDYDTKTFNEMLQKVKYLPEKDKKEDGTGSKP